MILAFNQDREPSPVLCHPERSEGSAHQRLAQQFPAAERFFDSLPLAQNDTGDTTRTILCQGRKGTTEPSPYPVITRKSQHTEPSPVLVLG